MKTTKPASEKTDLEKLREERKKAADMYSKGKGTPSAKGYKARMRTADKKMDDIVDDDTIEKPKAGKKGKGAKKAKKAEGSILTKVLSRLEQK